MPPSYPITHLVVGPKYAVLCAGPWIQVLDAETGELLSEVDTALPVRVLAVDEAFEHVVTAADNKKLVVRRRDGLEVLSSREMPKRATSITFADASTLVVADKFGDVFRYPLHSSHLPSTTTTPAPQGSSSTSEKPSSDGELLLGHVSIITALQLSLDRRYIITGDRDEHIRVSRYPASYVIEHFLFAHRKFVSALLIPPFSPSTLISGGGEPEVFFWDWKSAQLRGKVSYETTARPFMHVKPKRRVGGKKRAGSRSENGTPAAEEHTKEAAEAAEGAENGEAQDDEGNTGEEGGEGGHRRVLAEVEAPEDSDITFSVRKIAALSSKTQNVILFSLVGCSALFYLPFPSDSQLPTPAQLKALNLGKPILDFCVQGVCVWISLDMGWPGYETAGADVRLAVWDAGVLVPRFGESSPLLAGIGKLPPHDATLEPLKSLELYNDLLLLPKYAEEPEGDEPPGPKDRPGAKSEGRKKTREMLAKVTAGAAGSPEAERPESKRRKTEE